MCSFVPSSNLLNSSCPLILLLHVAGVGALTHKLKLGVCKLTCIVHNGFLLGFEDGHHQASLLPTHHIFLFFLVGSCCTPCTSFLGWKLLQTVFSSSWFDHILLLFLVGSYYTLHTSFPSWKLLHTMFFS
jgi:hypothetical protein